MAISFTPIPDDILEESAELSDAEVGRLLRWAVNYHKTGEAPKLSGNERYFAVRVKNFIDEREAARELKSKAGKASGIQRREQNAAETNTIEQTRTQSNTIEQNATEGSKSLYKDKDKDKDKSISNSVYISRVRAREDDGFDAFWEAYPRKSGDIQSAWYEYGAALDSGASPEELLKAVRDYPWPEEMRYIPSAEKWLKNRSWTEKPQERAAKKSSNKGRLGITDTLAVLNELREEFKEAGI